MLPRCRGVGNSTSYHRTGISGSAIMLALIGIARTGNALSWGATKASQRLLQPVDVTAQIQLLESPILCDLLELVLQRPYISFSHICLVIISASVWTMASCSLVPPGCAEPAFSESTARVSSQKPMAAWSEMTWRVFEEAVHGACNLK